MGCYCDRCGRKDAGMRPDCGHMSDGYCYQCSEELNEGNPGPMPPALLELLKAGDFSEESRTALTDWANTKECCEKCDQRLTFGVIGDAEREAAWAEVDNALHHEREAMRAAQVLAEATRKARHAERERARIAEGKVKYIDMFKRFGKPEVDEILGDIVITDEKVNEVIEEWSTNTKNTSRIVIVRDSRAALVDTFTFSVLCAKFELVIANSTSYQPL